MWPAGVFGKYSGSILGTYGVYEKRSESIHRNVGAVAVSDIQTDTHTQTGNKPRKLPKLIRKLKRTWQV
jgi:hypothetical protein